MIEHPDEPPLRNTAYAEYVQSEWSPLRSVERLGIVVFWLGVAIFNSLNQLVSVNAGGPGRPPDTIRSIEIIVVEALTWALLTPVIFRIAHRWNLERQHWFRAVVAMAVAGLVIALPLDVGVEYLRGLAGPGGPPRHPGGGPGGPGGPGDGGGTPFWNFARIHYINDLMVYFAVLSAGMARDYFLRYRVRLEEATVLRSQLAEARLAALRAQVNPHFLFNTLNAVSALVESDPAGVRRIIARLSEILRFTLRDTAESEIPLADELDLLRRYFEIIEIRFQGRARTSIEVVPNAARALVPNLILQPLVENAMKHALGRSQRGGRIAVEASVDGGVLILRVRDSGPGEPAAPGGPDAHNDGSGVGIRAVTARLAQLYGDDQSFALRPQPDGGMLAEIRLPYHTADDLRVAGLGSSERRA